MAEHKADEEIKENKEEKLEEELKEETKELEKEVPELKEVIEEPQEEAKEADEPKEEKEAPEEVKEEKKDKPKKEKKDEPKEEDEYLAMMKEDEEEKKAQEEAKEEIQPKEEKDIGDTISLIKEKKKPNKKKKVPEPEIEEVEESGEPRIYALRTTANREDQVMDFVSSNAARKKLEVYSIIRPHGMRGYIFLEAGSRSDAEQAAFGVPYARGLLPSIIQYTEIEHMLEQVKKEVNIQKNDIAEIISGPFKREKCKITRIDKTKEEVVVELLEAAVPIPITVKMDAVRVIRRDTDDEK